MRRHGLLDLAGLRDPRVTQAANPPLCKADRTPVIESRLLEHRLVRRLEQVEPGRLELLALDAEMLDERVVADGEAREREAHVERRGQRGLDRLDRAIEIFALALANLRR